MSTVQKQKNLLGSLAKKGMSEGLSNDEIVKKLKPVADLGKQTSGTTGVSNPSYPSDAIVSKNPNYKKKTDSITTKNPNYGNNQQPTLGVDPKPVTPYATGEPKVRFSPDGSVVPVDGSQPRVNNENVPTDTHDTNKDYVLSPDELGPDERAVYDQLTDAEKRQFDAIGENAIKNGQNVAKAQAEYFVDWKNNKDYQVSQNDIRTEIAGLDMENFDMASQERITNARTQLNNLKTNVAYLGTMGRPGVSAQRLDAVGDQIARAENTFKNLIDTEENLKNIKELGVEYDASAFARQLELLQNELDDNVNQALQETFNSLSIAELEGNLETIEDIERFRVTLLDNLDEQITGITDANIQQRAFLIERYDQIYSEKKEFIANKNTINPEMSMAQGMYIDGNGQPIISQSTGMPIPMPVDESPPMEPIFDAKSGKLISFFTDPNGNIQADVQQVIDQPTFSQQSMSGLLNAVQNGFISAENAMNTVPEGSRDIFAAGLGMLQKEQEQQEQPDAYSEKTVKVDDKVYQFNTKTGQYDIEVGTKVDPTNAPITGADASNLILSGNVGVLADKLEFGVEYDCGQQCGEWYNRAVGGKNDTRVGNSYASKVAFVDNSVTQGTPGMGVVFNPGTPGSEYHNYGHIGVLSSGLYTNENGENGYDVISANFLGNEKLTKDFITEGDIANTGGGFIPTNAQEELQDKQETEPVDVDSEFNVFDDGSNVDYQDILDFNDKVTRRDLSEDDKNRIAKAKGDVMQSPDSSIEDIMQWSLGGKQVGATQSQQLDKFGMAFDMLSEINGQLEDMKTGPVMGKLRKLNPYDTDRKLLEAALTGLVPTAARGIYGEVGVLTDTDIAHYVKTLPNLDNTRKQNEAILSMNLRIFAGGYKQKLASLAGQNYDVSGLEGTYTGLMNKVAELEASSGLGTPSDTPQVSEEVADWNDQLESDYNAIMGL